MSISVVGDGLLLSQKGDLASNDGTSTSTVNVGSNGQILVASSTSPSGLVWTTPTTAATDGYVAIAYASTTADTSTIVFSSITGSYAHLELHVSARCVNGVAQYIEIRFNSDTASNYMNQNLYGTLGVSTVGGNRTYSSTYLTAGRSTGGSAEANSFGAGVIRIYQYSSTSVYKPVNGISGYNENANGNIWQFSSQWKSTSAITSITIGADGFSTEKFVAGSTFALYGLRSY